MAGPARSERSRSARPSRQLSRFYRSINSDMVFGTHRFIRAAAATRQLYSFCPAVRVMMTACPCGMSHGDVRFRILHSNQLFPRTQLPVDVGESRFEDITDWLPRA